MRMSEDFPNQGTSLHKRPWAEVNIPASSHRERAASFNRPSKYQQAVSELSNCGSFHANQVVLLLNCHIVSL